MPSFPSVGDLVSAVGFVFCWYFASAATSAGDRIRLSSSSSPSILLLFVLEFRKELLIAIPLRTQFLFRLLLSIGGLSRSVRLPPARQRSHYVRYQGKQNQHEQQRARGPTRKYSGIARRLRRKPITADSQPLPARCARLPLSSKSGSGPGRISVSRSRLSNLPHSRSWFSPETIAWNIAVVHLRRCSRFSTPFASLERSRKRRLPSRRIPAGHVQIARTSFSSPPGSQRSEFVCRNHCAARSSRLTFAARQADARFAARSAAGVFRVGAHELLLDRIPALEPLLAVAGKRVWKSAGNLGEHVDAGSLAVGEILGCHAAEQSVPDPPGQPRVARDVLEHCRKVRRHRL